MAGKPVSSPCGAAWRRLLHEEEGVALVLAIVSMLVLTITLTAVIFMTAAGARDAQRTNAGQRAYSLAESGCQQRARSSRGELPRRRRLPGRQQAPHDVSGFAADRLSVHEHLPDGNGDLVRDLDNSPAGLSWFDQWNIASTATVPNPTGPTAAPVTRTVRAVVPVIRPPGRSDRAEQPAQLHLRERHQLPAEREGRLAGLCGQ